MSPASLKTRKASATSGISTTLPSTIRGSCSSAVRLCGAKWSVAICSARSRTASNVSRECSANRGRLVRDSTSSHSWRRKSRSRRDRIRDDGTAARVCRDRNVRRRTYVRVVQRMAGTSRVEGVVLDWVVTRPEPALRLPVSWLADREVATELKQIQRNRARDAAREAELILRLAELRPHI